MSHLYLHVLHCSTSHALSPSDNSPEAQARREEEQRKKEEAKEAEYIRQQEVLMKRRTGEWRNVRTRDNQYMLSTTISQEVARRRGQQYVEKRTGSIEPEPELPWAEQKRLIEEAARAAEEAEEAAKQATQSK